jgi:hypothetical protein
MAFRQRVLATTMADLQRVASTYFQQGQESIGIVSNRQALEEAQNRWAENSWYLIITAYYRFFNVTFHSLARF